ncbi:MAG: hypothetical protein MUD01_08140 [Chloroflexaceae bacterium]|jgi:ABC-type sugar transport system permease subunit|nr:hypothetical protein [Chloroflexaceae bacterium]
MRLVGTLLLLPFVVCWLGLLVAPTMQTITQSFTNARALPGGPAPWVGLENYVELVQNPRFTQVLGFTSSLIGVRLLFLLLPITLGLTIGVASRRIRLPVRLLFTIPAAFWAPTTAALSSVVMLTLLAQTARSRNWLANPTLAPISVLLLDALLFVTVACGVAVTVGEWLARGRQLPPESTNRSSLWPVLVLVGVLASIALALQEWSLPFLLTQGGPGNSTMTLGLLQYTAAFRIMRFGDAAAVAGLQLLCVAPLGLVALALLLKFKVVLRAAASATQEEQPISHAGLAPVLLGVAALIGLLLLLLSGVPLLYALATSFKSPADIMQAQGSFWPVAPTLNNYREVLTRMPLARAFGNTIVPPLLALLIQLPISYLAAFGIGVLRPLGRFSPWLLLLFSPWLFVGDMLLSPARFQVVASLGWVNTMPAQLLPLLCNVPVVVVLTLFFLGQSQQWHQARAAGQPASLEGMVVLPSLPLVALVACLSLLHAMQSLGWALLITNRPENQPFSVLLFTLFSQFTANFGMLAAATMLSLLIGLGFLLLLTLVQWLGVGRLALVREQDDRW